MLRGEMTVCIAAKCELLGQLVFVSDIMLSNDERSVEGARKLDLLIADAPPWAAAFAGEPEHFLPLMEHARAHLKASPPKTVDDVMGAIQSAHDARLTEKIERTILLPYGIKRDEFIQSGLECFGKKKFNDLTDRMESVSVGTDLVVAGFDATGRARMFELCKGETRRIDELDYHVIGMGDKSVLATLDPISWFAKETRIGYTVYRLLKAKFISEYVPSVGKETVAVIVSKDGQSRFVPDDLIQLARQVWEKERVAFPPDEISVPIASWFVGASD